MSLRVHRIALLTFLVATTFTAASGRQHHKQYRASWDKCGECEAACGKNASSGWRGEASKCGSSLNGTVHKKPCFSSDGEKPCWSSHDQLQIAEVTMDALSDVIKSSGLSTDLLDVEVEDFVDMVATAVDGKNEKHSFIVGGYAKVLYGCKVTFVFGGTRTLQCGALHSRGRGVKPGTYEGLFSLDNDLAGLDDATFEQPVTEMLI